MVDLLGKFNFLRCRPRIHFTLFAVACVTLILVVYRLSGESSIIVDRIPVQTLGQNYGSSSDQQSNFRDEFLQSAKMAHSENNYEPSVPFEALGPQRIVHLDLKGAPPRVSYLAELFPLLKKLGATGLLIEYEDMFPYSGVLADVPAFNCYSQADIREIVKLAEKSRLEVIPLIQTFGHMEFLLKLRPHSKLREVYRYPQAICPSHNKTFPLLTTMVDQILQLHPHSKRLHIGCDEVYQLGDCPRCVSVMGQERWGKIDLFLSHVSRIAGVVAARGVKPLVWDDELRKATAEQLSSWGLPDLVTPVVWKYTNDVAQHLPSEFWSKLSEAKLSPVFAASAFKGATGADQDVPDIMYHLENHRSWAHVADNAQKNYGVQFQGIILTGWQRYDHFAVLCELLPVGMPSLAANLALLAGASGEAMALSKARSMLNCQSSIEMAVKYPGAGLRCNYPGSEVLEAVLRLKAMKKELAKLQEESTVKGWMTDYNLKHNFSSPTYVEHATAELDRFRAELLYIERDIRTSMSSVYDRYTAEEWVKTNIRPIGENLQKTFDARERILSKEDWPRRPLDI
ncbi:hexosaminidase D-like isoform X2 [Neocloeon triangulifer]|uniref:hexosaminidase D-like isoform X2 n=1 Tax=Neocloeon triangulifer TaxID=2078957 RepID=UPI00286F5E30|nr:hexosaminidase D-like isoform X2 [Neocloeon triangulifer]